MGEAKRKKALGSTGPGSAGNSMPIPPLLVDRTTTEAVCTGLSQVLDAIFPGDGGRCQAYATAGSKLLGILQTMNIVDRTLEIGIQVGGIVWRIQPALRMESRRFIRAGEMRSAVWV